MGAEPVKMPPEKAQHQVVSQNQNQNQKQPLVVPNPWDVELPATASATENIAPTANDLQVGGRHYKGLHPQPWDVAIAWKLDFLEGNVLKYLARWKDKGGVEDLRKVIHYTQKLIEVENASPRIGKSTKSDNDSGGGSR